MPLRIVETEFAIPFQSPPDDRTGQDAHVIEQRPMSLYDHRGRRKYLTAAERQEFLRAARASHISPDVRTFCETLIYTGCRISEAIELTADRVDIDGGVLVFESLKKRRRGIYRAVPVPRTFLAELLQVHSLTGVPPDADRPSFRLWDWSRTTAWRRVSKMMRAAQIAGSHATPKGLRHGYGVNAISEGVPLNLLQKWLGHAQISTTAIYADASGPEEQRIAERMWSRDSA